jgi:manganese transport protein
MEAFIIALVAVIGFSFLIEVVMARPHLGEVVKGFVPSVLSNDALYIAVGIIGATVMPHNLYLHSALVQTRKIKADRTAIRQALKFNTIDSAVALNAAFLVNTAILVLAAAVFFTSGNREVAKIEDAHRLLEPMLGSKLAPVLFAVALIAAGQSSTVTGTLAGQIVMEGYLRLRINPLLRRLLTRIIAIIPAVLVILIYGEEKLDALLVFSQVILSLQLGFAIIPLIHFVSDKNTMGEFAIRWHVKLVAWLVAVILVYLNVQLVVQSSLEVYEQPGRPALKILVGIAWLIFAWLFVMMTLLPLVQRRRQKAKLDMHSEEKPLVNLTIPQAGRIAVALDFGPADEKLIAYALAQGKHDAEYFLVHIVETAPARYFGDKADDYESRNDSQRIELYAAQLRERGYRVHTRLGYKHRIREIVRIVKEAHADMLVMGAHRHSGLKDWLYGATVDEVRHKLTIPVLIVN